MIKNIFMDAGGVILNEDTPEELRAEIITALLNSYFTAYSIEDYWKDIEEAVYRFVPTVYDYVIFINTGNKNDFNHIKTEYLNK